MENLPPIGFSFITSQEMVDLANRIKEDDFFFSRIIGMIPREMYKPVEEESDENLNSRYYKVRFSITEILLEDLKNLPVVNCITYFLQHRKQPLQPDEKKLISKKKRSAKYSVDDQVNTKESEDTEEVNVTDSTQQHILEDSISPSDTVIETIPQPTGDSLENLRQILQQRIQSLKSTRTSKKILSSDIPILSVTTTDTDAHKKKTDSNTTSTSKTDKASTSSKNTSDKKANTTSNNKDSKQTVFVSTSSSSTTTSIRDQLAEKINPDKESWKTGEPGKPGTKMRRLKRMLEEAEKKKQRLDDLEARGSEGKQRVKAEAWGDALKDAAGDQGTLDASKLKKDRKETIDSAFTAKQDKREANIHKRKHPGEPLPTPAGENTPGSTGKPGSGSGTGATPATTTPKRPRLYHVLKDKEKKSTAITVGGKGSQLPAQGGGSGGGSSYKGEGGGGGGGRAGFEGKKMGFLNSNKKGPHNNNSSGGNYKK
eukprot:gene1046-2048_t